MVTSDSNGKPFQLKFVRAAQMQLFANAVCDPPLGSTTVVPYGERVTLLFASPGQVARYMVLNCVRSNLLSF